MYSPTVRPRCIDSRPLIRYQARCFSIRDRPNRSRSQVRTLRVPGSVDLAEGLGERLPLQQLGVRAGGFDELVLVRVEQGGALLLRELVGALERPWPTSATIVWTRSVSRSRWLASSLIGSRRLLRRSEVGDDLGDAGAGRCGASAAPVAWLTT